MGRVIDTRADRPNTVIITGLRPEELDEHAAAAKRIGGVVIEALQPEDADYRKPTSPDTAPVRISVFPTPDNPLNGAADLKDEIDRMRAADAEKQAGTYATPGYRHTFGDF